MASGKDGALIWTRPEPGTRRPKFTRDQLAAAALAIADAEGFAAVSMRRIAADLGAGTMTLYHYVRTKDELVALMDDAIMAEVLIPPGELPAHWHSALTAIATRTWDVLMRHPWAPHHLRNAPAGPNSMRHFEQSLAAVAGTGLDAASRLALLGMVDDYVQGSALRADEARSGQTPPAGTPEARFAEAQLATGDYPHIQALFGGDDPRAAWSSITEGVSGRDRFHDGLSALLLGAATRMDLPLPGG